MDLRKNAISMLTPVPVTGVGMQDGDGKTDLYTGKPGEKYIVTHCIIHSPTASLAGGTDYDFGDGANADTWRNAVNLTTMTAASDYYIVEANNAKYTIFDAGDVFGIKPVTGATANADATIIVLGIVWAA